MSVLQKHVVKEIVVPFCLAFAVITFLMLMGRLLHELADQFLNKGLALSEIGLMTLYLLPQLVPYTIPIALLFATLIAFIQLSQDCEIIAMKAAGIPMRKVFAPAILIGVVATIFLLALRAEVSPWARRKLKVSIIEMVLKRPTLVLSEQAWTPEFNNMRIFVGNIDDRRMLLRDVKVLINDEDKPSRTMVAKSGRIYIDGNREKVFLELSEGSVHEYDMERPDEYSTTTFSRLTVPVNIDELDRYLKKYQNLESVRHKEMSVQQLARRLSSPSLRPKEKRSLLRDIGERTALAFMPLTFVLIGAPLGIIPYKTRRFYGLSVCAGLILAYYSLLIMGETLSEKGLMNPLIAMWLPNVLIGVAGVVLMIRAERQ
jgi:lipopolysaccharide export system permease protein